MPLLWEQRLKKKSTQTQDLDSTMRMRQRYDQMLQDLSELDKLKEQNFGSKVHKLMLQALVITLTKQTHLEKQ